MGSCLIETGRPHTCNISTKESYPSTEPKLGDWRGTPSRSSCWVTKRKSTTAAPQASSSDAYPSPKVRSYYKKYTRGLAATTPHLGPSLEMPSDRVSTGQPRWPTPLGLYAPAKGVNSTQSRRTCKLRPCKQDPSPGHLLYGVWTSSVPCRRHPGATRTLMVAIDKFSKWIEVRPLNSIRSEQAVAFFTNIIHRFGVPNSITDNGTQFTGRKFLDFCEDHNIWVDWAAVAHPMTNGQVERGNGMILQGLKPRIYNDLNKFGRRWVKELPSVVWSLRTTPSRATGFALFFLVYGAEAILPTDLEFGSPRTRAYDDRSNRTNREVSLDQLEEARDVALLHSARYQQSLRRYHAPGVRSRDLQVGDLVLQLRQDTRGCHKLTPPWEGPFIIAKILKPGTYKLANSQGEVYSNAWNIRQLRRFYP
jgi:transposase InsO family protein